MFNSGYFVNEEIFSGSFLMVVSCLSVFVRLLPLSRVRLHNAQEIFGSQNLQSGRA